MQQIQKTLNEKVFISITGATWVAGLLIAGSDSPYMPWVNGIGVVLFFCSSLLMGKLLQPAHPQSNGLKNKEFHQKAGVENRASQKCNQGLNTLYALKI